MACVRQALPEDKMNEIKLKWIGDGLLLFDDFVDVMHRFVDVRAEHDILEKLEDKGAILWGELQALSHRSAKLPLVVLGLFFLSVVNMVFDVYLMAQSLYVRHYRLKRRIATYLGTFTAFFEHISFSSFVSVLKWSSEYSTYPLVKSTSRQLFHALECKRPSTYLRTS